MAPPEPVVVDYPLAYQECRMNNALWSTVPILAALVLGLGLGQYINNQYRGYVSRCVGGLVWALLFSLGAEFGSVLGNPEVAARSLLVGITFAVVCTFATWLLIHLLTATSNRGTAFRMNELLSSIGAGLKSCTVTLSIVALGAIYAHFPIDWISQQSWKPTLGEMICVLVFLVGIELAKMKLSRNFFTLKSVSVPLITVVGTLLGGLLAAWVVDEPLKIGLVIASGFGWMSLSSAMVSETLGESYGSMVLITDLLRELLAITLLYVCGMKAPLACIGATGVTSLDSTLPIIRMTCPEEAIPYAVASGLILTVTSPLFIAFFLTL
ncbi:hypothetical protein D3C80_1279880 [compost metagenome]